MLKCTNWTLLHGFCLALSSRSDSAFDRSDHYLPIFSSPFCSGLSLVRGFNSQSVSCLSINLSANNSMYVVCLDMLWNPGYVFSQRLNVKVVNLFCNIFFCIAIASYTFTVVQRCYERFKLTWLVKKIIYYEIILKSLLFLT